MKLRLILCAFGRHAWSLYAARNAVADRDTRRECAACGHVQERLTGHSQWQDGTFLQMRVFDPQRPRA